MSSARTSAIRDAHASQSSRARLLAAPVFVIVLAACGASTAVESASDGGSAGISETAGDDGVGSGASAEHTAAENLPTLQGAEVVFDVEVLSVADGSVSSLRDVVTGDRPVLVWFYAPH